MAADQTVDERIRARARRLWEEEGRPEGRAEAHWEQARLFVAMEDAQPAMLKPIQAPAPEPIAAVQNLGEFPTLTDQGEEQTYPSPRSELRAHWLQEVSGGVDAGHAEAGFSASPGASHAIVRSASELARQYTGFVFLRGAAAGFALSRFLKSWFRNTQ